MRSRFFQPEDGDGERLGVGRVGAAPPKGTGRAGLWDGMRPGNNDDLKPRFTSRC